MPIDRPFDEPSDQPFDLAPTNPADNDPHMTTAGVHRRAGEHVHGGGMQLRKGVRMCLYCDTPVRLTPRGWQPLSPRRSRALVAWQRSDGGLPWGEAGAAGRGRRWHWLRYPVQSWGVWRRSRI